jgi:hypothetical protein
MSPVADAISPKPLLDKLGVPLEGRIVVIGLDDDGFRGLLAERGVDVSAGRPDARTDAVFLGADSLDGLAPLPDLAAAIRPDAAIWIVSRKGRAATLRYEQLLGVAKAAGLVDNKVVAFSDTHTALRFVIPRALRPRR